MLCFLSDLNKHEARFWLVLGDCPSHTQKTIDLKRIFILSVLASQFGASTCLSHSSTVVSYVVEVKSAKETYWQEGATALELFCIHI